MNTSWKQICTCKSHNLKQVWNKKTWHYHITATLPQNILQLQLHLFCTLYSINKLRFTKIRVSWNGELPLHQGFTTFCRPHYFYLHEVWPPLSSRYIYEMRLIREHVTVKWEPTQNTFKHRLRIYSITFRDITSRLLHIVSTYFLALRLFCFNIRQHGCQIFYFKLHVDGCKLHSPALMFRKCDFSATTWKTI